MKTLLITAAFIGLSFPGSAQVDHNNNDTLVGRREWRAPALPLKGSKIIYEETVAVGAAYNRNTLFKNALEWYNYNYKSSDTRLTVENQEKGLISGTGVIRYTPAAAGEGKEQPIIFYFDIAVNDGSYTYRIYDMYGRGPSGRFGYADMYREDRYPSRATKARWDKKYRYEMLSDMDTYIKLMIAHLKQSMIKS